MGYDVSFHPISPEEMREWYFTPLTWIQKGQEEKVLAIAAQHGMEDFYAEKISGYPASRGRDSTR